VRQIQATTNEPKSDVGIHVRKRSLQSSWLWVYRGSIIGSKECASSRSCAAVVRFWLRFAELADANACGVDRADITFKALMVVLFLLAHVRLEYLTSLVNQAAFQQDLDRNPCRRS
jgi:hypothetical protein